jgi:hypothetical protein
MTIALAQTVYASDAGGSTTGGFNISYPSANTAGNLLVFVLRLGGDPGATFTVTDSRSNTWVKVFQTTANADDGSILSIWYAKNCAAGANNVQFATTNSITSRYTLSEYSGIDTSTALDKSTSNVSGTFSTTPTISSAQTPTNASSLVIAAVSTGDANTFAAGTNYTAADTTGTNGHLGYEHRILSSSSSQAPFFTLTPGAPYNIGMAVFNGASGGGTTATATPGVGAVNTSGLTPLDESLHERSYS